MSNENGNTGGRRASVTSAAFSNLFQRSNSTSAGSGIPPMDQRRRMSVTTVGLSGTSPTSNGGPPFNGFRRGSISTNNSDAIDENAVEDDDSPRPPPNPSFGRRMSIGAQAMRPGQSSPPSNGNAYNWSEQLRSRAESSVSGSRPTFSNGQGSGGLSSSPTRTNGHHDRTRSVSDMPAPPQQATTMKPKQPERPKPDAFQERILKGDFYMD